MAQLDFRNILRLRFVNSELYHEIRNNLAFLLGISDNRNSLVNVKQNLFKTLEQMQPVLCFFKVKADTPENALASEAYPFNKNFSDRKNLGITVDEDVEIAGKRILKGCGFVKLLHKLFRINSPFEVDGNFKTLPVRFIADIADFLESSALDAFDNFVDYRLRSGGGRYLIYIYAITVLVIFILCTDFY